MATTEKLSVVEARKVPHVWKPNSIMNVRDRMLYTALWCGGDTLLNEEGIVLASGQLAPAADWILLTNDGRFVSVSEEEFEQAYLPGLPERSYDGTEIRRP